LSFTAPGISGVKGSHNYSSGEVPVRRKQQTKSSSDSANTAGQDTDFQPIAAAAAAVVVVVHSQTLHLPVPA
jgi:hypothetical protein